MFGVEILLKSVKLIDCPTQMICLSDLNNAEGAQTAAGVIPVAAKFAGLLKLFLEPADELSALVILTHC